MATTLSETRGEQSLLQSLATVSQEVGTALSDEPAVIDESYLDVFNGLDLMLDVTDQRIGAQEVSGLDQFAQFLTDDLGELVNDQLACLASMT